MRRAAHAIFLTLSVCAPVHVAGWRVTLVNQEVRRVAPNGSVPLCQAIPPIGVAPVLRAGSAHPTRVVGRLRSARRVIHLRRHAAPVFTAQQLGGDFAPGAYRFTVRRRGRVLARATLRLTAGDGLC